MSGTSFVLQHRTTGAFVVLPPSMYTLRLAPKSEPWRAQQWAYRWMAEAEQLHLDTFKDAFAVVPLEGGQ